MRIVEISEELKPADVNRILMRADQSIESVMDTVNSLIEEVFEHGEKAIQRQVEQFDGVKNPVLKVSPEQLSDSLEEIDEQLLEAMKESIARLRLSSADAMPQSVTTSFGENSKVIQRYSPVDSVAVYAPGGKAVYPSSVIMNVVPAQVAGVSRIGLFSPAQADGLPATQVLAAAKLLGISEVYSIGGVGAVAAAAFGLESLQMQPFRMFTGPGNVYLAAAKRSLRGRIGIDSEAGPTEIMILADETANPSHVAADLLSQAEHDENAACVLVTNSLYFAEKVNLELQQKVNSTKNSERANVSLNGPQSLILVVGSDQSMITAANEYAAEHLSLQLRDNEKFANLISNAGALFLGSYSPVSLGDYMAGSNHVLPTGGQGKHSSGLGVLSFLRAQQVIDYSKQDLLELEQKLVSFSESEGLPAHGEAITARRDS
ncbi:MAG TPA: histidinol dehydrogenase [Microbacteriaceae bacterium]